MAAGVYNLVIEQGATFTLPIKVTMDLTGYSARMQIRSEVGSPTAHLTLTSAPAGGIVISAGATESTIELTIPATTSSAFTFTKGVYDLEITSSGGVVTRLLKGTVVVDPEVTTA